MKQNQNKEFLGKITLNNCWVDTQGCDAETLVEITREMTSLFYNEQIKFDDSRCFYRLCIDMAKEFQELHKDCDWDEKDFLTEIITFSRLVRGKLIMHPDWGSTDYKWMYGEDEISDLMKK